MAILNRRNSNRFLQATLLLVLSVLLPRIAVSQSDVYYPGPWGQWETRTAAEVGMDEGRLAEAVSFAKAAKSDLPIDLGQAITDNFAREPHFSIIGPVRERGEANGLIVRRGYIVAEWGDTSRVDMTFSVTKSYLSTVAGLAIDQGLIRDLHDPVKDYIRDGTFDSEHNAKITWHHLLNQTSDWSGTLWDKPDWADRPQGDDPENRPLQEPGSRMTYNDVRVNLLAYCLTNVFRRPLPEVLRESVMDPINASPTWRWYGYENSWITLDGRQVQCVSGGGHWGGGMFISTRDHARFGYLFLRGGQWGERQLVSPEWITAATTPTPVKSDYGYMWWLNTDRERMDAAPADSYSAAGFGGNYIYIDPDNDLLIVVRWTPAVDGVVERVIAAIE
jgi:CubicO group peptidase (beta-lactamase class C family)